MGRGPSRETEAGARRKRRTGARCPSHSVHLSTSTLRHQHPGRSGRFTGSYTSPTFAYVTVASTSPV